VRVCALGVLVQCETVRTFGSDETDAGRTTRRWFAENPGPGATDEMRLAACSGAFRNRNVFATLLGFAGFALVIHGAWLATAVYAFEQGGASETGVVALGMQLPAAVLCPAAAVWFDRFTPRIALMLGFGFQAVMLVFVAGAVWTDSSKYIVYLLLTCLAVIQGASRPNVSAVLPRLVVDPGELAASNSAMGAVETTGLVAGPALVGFALYLTDSLAIGFLVCAVVMVLASAIALVIETTSEPVTAQHTPSGLWGEVSAGMRTLRAQAAPRHLVIAIATTRLTVGVLDVGIVVVAIQHLGRSEASAGMLGTAIGLGAVVGSALSFLLIGQRRLSTPILLGIACTAIPIAAIAVSKDFVAILLLVGLSGLGRPIVEVAGRTVLQRLGGDRMLTQIFGLLEGLSLLIIALGGGLFALLVVVLNVEAALVITGLLPCAVAASLITALRSADDSPQEPTLVLWLPEPANQQTPNHRAIRG